MILQGVGHPILCLGVCCANDPKKGGYTPLAPALDLTTSLRGDFSGASGAKLPAHNGKDLCGSQRPGGGWGVGAVGGGYLNKIPPPPPVAQGEENIYITLCRMLPDATPCCRMPADPCPLPRPPRTIMFVPDTSPRSVHQWHPPPPVVTSTRHAPAVTPLP